MSDDFKHRMAQWIPSHVSPKILVGIYTILDKTSFIKGSVRKDHKSANIDKLKSEGSPLKDGFIENQSAWKGVLFGKVDMAYSGCEIMAVYNILHAMGKETGPELVGDLIESFEKSGAALKGRIGSSPRAIRAHLKRRGIDTRFIWKEDDIDESVDKAIVTYYNNQKSLYHQIHTVAFIREEAGFVPHNARSRQRAYPSLKEAIHGVGSDPKVICIIEIIEPSNL
jgi:hypothetical protein